MNCNQARMMLAAYREMKNEQEETALFVHLEWCAACRQVLTQYTMIGERVRSLPSIEPPGGAYTKLMRALAFEHSRFMQHSPMATPPAPDFLKPYLKEQVQSTQTTDILAAFSTAETGPLPIIRARQRRRRSSHLSQFTVLGLAATFLMVMMVGGLTTLLFLAHRTLPANNSTSIVIPAGVAMAKYTTTTPYPYVASAVADREHIYYSAYGDGTRGWMIEQLDSQTKLSTPLLSTTSTSPLIVLGSSQGWLVWLQMDIPKPVVNPHPLHHVVNTQTRTWSLHTLFIQHTPAFGIGEPVTLVKGTFDQSTVPAWVHRPVQDVWFVQGTLLVAIVDGKGNAHLLRYQLDTEKGMISTELATATNGHIITSPTANSDGKSIYWSEEWLSNDNMLHSEIWTQQIVDAVPSLHGKWRAHTITIKHVFSTNDMSFHPQVVNNTLFFLNIGSLSNTVQATPGTAVTVAPPTATPNIVATPVTSRVDPTIYVTQFDEAIRGTLAASPLDGDSAQPVPLVSVGSASALQAGTNFLLWQSDKGYEMYDVVEKLSVRVGNAPSRAAFLTVNGDTAVWTSRADSTTDKSAVGSTIATFRMFNWPSKA